MKYVFYCLMMFMSGGIFIANIIDLIPTNPNFHGSWISVFLSIALFLFFAGSAKD